MVSLAVRSFHLGERGSSNVKSMCLGSLLDSVDQWLQRVGASPASVGVLVR